MDIIPTDSSLLLYQTEDGQTKIEVRLHLVEPSTAERII